MPFPIFTEEFRHNLSTIPARFLNKVRRELPRALDGAGGGDYTLVNLLEIIGEGLSAFFFDLTGTGILNWEGTAQDLWRIQRISQDSDFTVRGAGVLYDLIHVDGDALSVTRTCTLADASDSGLLEGEIVYVVHENPSQDLKVHSEGGASNPLITLGSGAGTDPEWAAFWFDAVLGEWRTLAHGNM